MFVLIVGSDREERAVFSRIIRERGYEAVSCSTYRLAEKLMKSQQFELALVDIDLNPSGLSWLQRCSILAPAMQLVTLTRDVSREQEIQTRTQNISMYLIRPVAPSIIEMIIAHRIEKKQRNSQSHSNQYLRRLRCAPPHRTCCTASSPPACLLDLVQNAT